MGKNYLVKKTTINDVSPSIQTFLHKRLCKNANKRNNDTPEFLKPHKRLCFLTYPSLASFITLINIIRLIKFYFKKRDLFNELRQIFHKSYIIDCTDSLIIKSGLRILFLNSDGLSVASMFSINTFAAI